eukprot:27377-Pyramimonas_sp.AAC.1
MECKGCWAYIRGGDPTVQLFQSYRPGPVAGSRNPWRAYLLSGCKDYKCYIIPIRNRELRVTLVMRRGDVLPTVSGVQALLGGLATLATLNLRGCNRMRNEGVRALTHLSSLTRLTLSYNNRVTAEGLRSLGALSRPPRDERDARAGHALLAHGARPLHRVASERGRPPPFGPLTESRLPRAQLLRPFQPGRAGRAGRPQQSGPPKPQPLLGADGRAAR